MAKNLWSTGWLEHTQCDWLIFLATCLFQTPFWLLFINSTAKGTDESGRELGWSERDTALTIMDKPGTFVTLIQRVYLTLAEQLYLK